MLSSQLKILPVGLHIRRGMWMGMLSFRICQNKIFRVLRVSRRGADGFLVWKPFIASGACVILDSGSQVQSAQVE